MESRKSILMSILILAALLLLTEYVVADPIHDAAKEGNVGEIRRLIKGGADINAKDPLSLTALHIAAARGQRKVVKLLISKGADINAKMKDTNDTPLHLAVQNRYKEFAELLILKGANINAESEYGTPLKHAILIGNEDIAELLRKHGAHE